MRTLRERYGFAFIMWLIILLFCAVFDQLTWDDWPLALWLLVCQLFFAWYSHRYWHGC